MSAFKKQFGKRIKEIRKNKGLTQEQIAEKIGIEPPNVSKLESGMHFPLPENIEKIAKALNVDVKELFDFEHHKTPEELKFEIQKMIDNNPDKLKEIYKLIKAII